MDSLEGRLNTLEKRLEAIEKQLEINNSKYTNKVQTPSSETVVLPRSWHELQPKSPELNLPIEEETLKGEPLSGTFKTGNWLGIIAVICFVFAAGFLIKLSVESGWLTPEHQVVFASLFGLVLIAIGYVLKDCYMHYASLLPASGIIILYRTFRTMV